MTDPYLGTAIRILREQLRWSQAELSRVSGVQAQAISDIEAGNRMPAIPTLYELAEAMDVEAWRIMRRAERLKEQAAAVYVVPNQYVELDPYKEARHGR